MLIALYRGTSWTSKAIEWVTRSPYSHAAFLLDDASALAVLALIKDGFDCRKLVNVTAGSVLEAWQAGGVRSVASLSAQHTSNTTVDVFSFTEPLTAAEEKRLLRFCVEHIGDPYDWKNVFRFVTRHAAKEDDAWFCSELVSEACKSIARPLFNLTESWRIPPDWIPRSLAVNWNRMEKTV